MLAGLVVAAAVVTAAHLWLLERATGLVVQIAFLAVLGVGGVRVASGAMKVGAGGRGVPLPRGPRARPADVSFTVPARGLTAIVGPSGAGKTTLFALLERFYEPSAGRIAFGGRDLRAWPRAQIGYVEQEAPVLAGTLRDNLLYAAPEADDEALAAVIPDARGSRSPWPACRPGSTRRSAAAARRCRSTRSSPTRSSPPR